MQSLKNVISLNQAAKISGYTQDYLGSLIRSGEIKGVKKGGIWFTTEEEITHYISKQKAIHRKLAVKDFFERISGKVSSQKLAVRDFISHLSPRNFLVSSLVLFVAFSSTGFYFFKKYNSDLALPDFKTPSFVLALTDFASQAKNISLPTFPTLSNFPSLSTFPNPLPVLKKIGTVYVDGIASGFDSYKKIGRSLSKNSQIKIDTTSNLASVEKIPALTASVGSSLADGFDKGMNSFAGKIRSSARAFLGITDVNPKIYIQEVPVLVKEIPSVDPLRPTGTSPLAGGGNTNAGKTIVKNTIEKRDVIINQYDPTVLPRLKGIELAILNNVSHNSVQTDRIYVSTGSNIGNAIHSVTQSGTLNSPTLNDATFANFTSTGRSDFTRVPTLAHAFTTWPSGTSNASNATLVINPASSVANGNLIGASVADVVKFIVDAEGNIYGNSVVLTGSVTSGATTASSLSVLDNTILGDAPTDTITTNARWNSHILPITDNLYNIGSATNRWASIYASNINVNTNGTNALISTFVGANSDGLNLFIGGGGQSSVGAVGSTISGSSNTSLGINALPANTTGHYNTAIGALALFSNTTGLENTAVGRGALYYNTSAIENTAIGAQAMKYNTTGDLNTGLGTHALYNNTTGYSNTAIGQDVMFNNTTGGFNVATGVDALYDNTTGSNNTATGFTALRGNTTGSGNTAMGEQALLLSTTGNYNVAMGQSTLYSNVTGSGNTGLGSYALQYNTASDNTAVGYNALNQNSSGTGNTALGTNSLLNSGVSVNNTALGYGALSGITGGDSNIGLGYNAGKFISGGVTANANPNGSIYIGNNAYPLANTEQNEIVIGNSAVGIGSNTIALGNNLNTKTLMYGALGLGVTPTISGIEILDTTANAPHIYIHNTSTYNNSFGLGADNIGYIGSIGSANATPLRVLTNGSTRMYFDTAGNVGIGTTSPGVKLSNTSTRLNNTDGLSTHLSGFNWEVNGQGQTAAFSNLSVATGNHNAGVLVKLASADATDKILDLESGGVNRVRVLGNGNVGLGTISPTANLQVTQGTAGAGTVSTTATLTTVTGVGTQFLNTFKVGDTITVNAETRTIATITSNTSLTTDAWTGTNSNVAYTLVGGTRFSVLGNGNIGIGTTSPTYKLDVNGSIRTTDLRQAGNAYFTYDEGATGTGDAIFRNGYGDEKVRIKNGGNVGIGTTNPISTLQIAKSAGTTGVALANMYLTLGGTADDVGSGTRLIGFGYNLPGTTTNIPAYMGYVSTSGSGFEKGALVFGTRDVITDTAPTERMRIDTTGSVGIGTTAPGSVTGLTVVRPTVTGGVAALLREETASATGTTGYGLAIESEASAATSYALILRNLAGSTVYGGVSTATGQVGYWGIGASPAGTLGSRLTVGGGASIGSGYTANAAPTDGMIVQGNVGIGTTNPSGYSAAKVLNLYQTGANVSQFVMEGDTGASFLALTSGTTGNPGILYSNQDIRFGTATNKDTTGFSEKMRLTTTGNLGIGTTNPGKLLQVEGSNGEQLLVKSGNTAWTAGVEIDTGAANADWTITSSGGTAGLFQIQNVDQGGTPPFNINLGNVGIGTTNPAATLEANGTIQTMTATLNVGSYTALATNDSKINFFTNAQGVYKNWEINSNGIVGGALSITPSAIIGGNTFSTPAMTILQGGNVGIGTTNPGYDLDIQAITAEQQIKSTTGTNYAYLNFNNTGGNFYVGRERSTTGGLMTGSSPYAAIFDAYGTYPMQFGVNDTIAMTILNGGNVGIGTTAPGALLALQGNTPTALTGTLAVTNLSATVTGTTTAFTTELNAGDAIKISGVVYQVSSIASATSLTLTTAYAGATASGLTGYKDANLFAINNGFGTNKVTIDKSGNVGIGTTGPSEKLQIGSALGNVWLSGGGNFMVESGQGIAYALGSAGESSARFGADITLKTANTARVTILNNGNVGIGTTGPQANFDVTIPYAKTDATIRTFAYFGKSNDATAYSALQMYMVGGAAAANRYWAMQTIEQTQANAGSLVFQPSGGNVGIGTTAPAAKLHVIDPGTGQYTARFGTGAVSQFANVDIISNSGANAFQVWDDNVLTVPRFIIQRGGNVGIGTTNPGQKLEVNGIIKGNGGIYGYAGATNNLLIDWSAASQITTLTATDLFFGTNATERMRILANGNVGIGTTNPLSTLHVNGEIIRQTNGGSTTFWGTDATGTYLRTFGGDSYRFQRASGNETMRLTTDGNVGIGTTVPGALLALQGNTPTALTGTLAVTNLSATVTGTTTAFTTELNVGDAIKISGVVYQVSSIASATSLTLTTAYAGATASGLTGYKDANLFAINNGFGTNKVTIDKSGNVGIGTTSPGQKLEVNGQLRINPASGTGSESLLWLDQAGTNKGMLGLEPSVGGGSVNDVSLYSRSGQLIFWTNNAKAMTINTSGNVGIGTTTPGQKLEVAGNVIVGNGQGYMVGVSNSYLSREGTNRVSLTAGGIEALSILETNGNVGIGTTNPAQKLEVSGTIRQTGCLTAGTISVNASGDIICTPSSIKFKNERVDLMDGLQTLIQLNPVSYKFNSDMNLGSETHFGFISEEVNAVLPEFATHDASGKPYGLDATAILAVTVNAVKELNLNLNSIAGKEISATPASDSFTKAFFDNVFAKVNTWLASATNGIGDIFAKRVNTDTLCVSDAVTGAKTCINKGQLDSLMASAGGVSGIISSGGSGTPPVVEKTATEKLTDANAKLNAVVIENYTAESAASFATAKDAAVALPESTDAEKLAKVKAIDDAIALLVLKVIAPAPAVVAPVAPDPAPTPTPTPVSVAPEAPAAQAPATSGAGSPTPTP